MEQTSKSKPARLRSPNYPAFPLSDAISKINILWDKDRKAGAHRSVVLKHLGFNAESGTALRNLSTLKIFGLTSEKDRHIVLTENALDIILYSHDKNVYYRALKDVALKPSIYNILYNKYADGLPSFDALKSELSRVHNFNPNIIDRFIEDFKATLEYAGLLNGKDETDKVKPERYEETKEMKDMVGRREHGGSQLGLIHSFPIPFLKGNKATIVFDKLPVQQSDLDKIKKWIDLFGESLVDMDKKGEN